MQKQSPSAPKSPSQSEQRQRLERQLERYSCTLDKSLSEQARLLGLERGQTVCALVNEAVDDFIKRKREPQPDIPRPGLGTTSRKVYS